MAAVRGHGEEIHCSGRGASHWMDQWVRRSSRAPLTGWPPLQACRIEALSGLLVERTSQQLGAVDAVAWVMRSSRGGRAAWASGERRMRISWRRSDGGIACSSSMATALLLRERSVNSGSEKERWPG